MISVEFWKTETIGNDFVLVEAGAVPTELLPEFARHACERRFGVGADGLLVVGRAGAAVTLRMFNPDGTEDFCGNGLRCAADHAHRQGWVGAEFTVLHGGRDVPARVGPQGEVTVTLPPADFRPEAVPVRSDAPWLDRPVQGVTGSAVSTGSTHFVVLVDALPGDDAFFQVSPLVEHDPHFPAKTSVVYACPEGDRRLRLRIWERSVGETLGCGTGSVAAAVVWARKTGLSGEFEVGGAGGDVRVAFDSWEGPVSSTTLPHRVFSGRLAFDRARAVVRLGDAVAGTVSA